jgi:hypothetical protein
VSGLIVERGTCGKYCGFSETSTVGLNHLACTTRVWGWMTGVHFYFGINYGIFSHVRITSAFAFISKLYKFKYILCYFSCFKYMADYLYLRTQTFASVPINTLRDWLQRMLDTQARSRGVERRGGNILLSGFQKPNIDSVGESFLQTRS